MVINVLINAQVINMVTFLEIKEYAEIKLAQIALFLMLLINNVLLTYQNINMELNIRQMIW
jgi:hypothetical protein